eukprot:jgi/Bigna1/90502/estExt_fgenesh1_pg.C_720025
MRRRSRALLDGGYKRMGARQFMKISNLKETRSYFSTGALQSCKFQWSRCPSSSLSCAFATSSSTTRSLIQKESLNRSDPIVRASLTGFVQKHLQLMTDNELKEMQKILKLNDKRLKMYLDSGITPPQLRDFGSHKEKSTSRFGL